MLAILLFSSVRSTVDTVKVFKAHLPSPPSEYVPLTLEEIRGLARINHFEKGRENDLKDESGNNADGINFLPYPSDTVLIDFETIDYTNWIPPDPQMVPGSTYVGVVVNSHIAFYDKTDGSEDYYNTLRGFFSSIIPSGGMAFDPKIAYDLLAGRWLVLALYYNGSTQSAHYLLAVSRTDDPMGGWYFYRLNAKYDDNTLQNNWADYPEIGFNDRWIVLTSQQIGFSSYDYYPKVRVLDKAAAYNGTLSGWIEDFVDSELSCMYNWPRPSRSTYDYSTDVYLVRFNRMYKLYGPTNNPQLSSCITLSLSSYSYPPDAPQGGGYQELEVVGATFQVYYMNGKLYYTFHDEHPLNSSLAAGRLVILDTSGSVVEDRALYENGVSWIYPAVTVSPRGIAVSFTRVGTSAGDYPSAAFIARASYDTAFSPVRMRAGLSWYFNDKGTGRNRWGDYFGGGPDPVDSTLWVIAELVRDGYDDRWTTWVFQIDFDTPAVDVVERSQIRTYEGSVYTVDGRRSEDIKSGRVYFVVKDGKVKRILKVR